MEARHQTHSIRLSDDEIVMVKAIAKHRMESCRRDGVVDRAIAPIDCLFLDENGYGGEFALARWLNTYPHYPTKRADMTYRGWTLDAKTTTHGHGGLLVERWTKDCPADVYFLVTGRLPQYELVGWLFADQVFVPDHAADLGRGPMFLVPQHLLRAPDELREIVPAWEAFP